MLARLLRPLVLATLVASSLLAAPSASARGWQEAHQSSDDVRVTVGADGQAMVEHHLRYRIVAGHFKTLDLVGIDPRAQLVAEATALPEKGGEIAARVEPDAKNPGSVRVSFIDEPKGLGRGNYVLGVKYHLDLVATKTLVRDGAMWRLAWTAPPSPEGHDGARVVFQLPSAPTEPRLASPEQMQTTVATLRRQADRDELELVRAHVPRGEAVTWSVRVDPKAFPQVRALELRTPPSALPAAADVPNRVPVALGACALATLAGALAFALRKKQAMVARACEAAGVMARPLVAIPRDLGPFIYGALVVAALGELLWATPTWGAVFVVVAMAIAAHRAPAPVSRPRGPGRWLPISDAEVLVAKRPEPSAGDGFDIGTRSGKVAALAVAVVVACLTFVLRTRVAGAGIAIPLAAMALVPLFVTGTRAQLPPRPGELAVRLLRPARDALGRLLDLTHVEVGCLARFREGARGDFDEVRLTCIPTDRIPGLRAIELALSAFAPGAYAALPEVFVRFDDASPAAAKIAQIAPGLALVPGRAPEEKVLRLAPRAPTPASAARLLARLASDLEGRRASDRPEPASRVKSAIWAGTERRGPRPAAPAGPLRVAL